MKHSEIWPRFIARHCVRLVVTQYCNSSIWFIQNKYGHPRIYLDFESPEDAVKWIRGLGYKREPVVIPHVHNFERYQDGESTP